MHERVSSVLDGLLSAGEGRPVAALCTGQPGGLNALLRIEQTHTGVMPDELCRWHPAPAGAPANDLASGWLFAIDYEHAHHYEPRGGSRHRPVHPTATWMRFRRAEQAAATTTPAKERGYTLGPLASRTGRAGFVRGVGAALGHIAAGDVYQINLTHQLEGAFSGCTRALFADLVRAADPWFGAYLELPAAGGLPARVIASASPEMFLTIAPGGVITTRPMKGTRAGSNLAHELDSSEKERAELTMIVDLMRNDLGRVCVPGSIHVPAGRTIEAHAGGTILQATGTVRGQLREGATLGEVLAATFPPGSVTGAPKLRAMQLIEALEHGPRGPYCGIIGYATDSGHAGMSVAIRTAVIEGGRLTYGVGAGIVADSDPQSEWEETLAKAGVIMGLARERGARM